MALTETKKACIEVTELAYDLLETSTKKQANNIIKELMKARSKADQSLAHLVEQFTNMGVSFPPIDSLSPHPEDKPTPWLNSVERSIPREPFATEHSMD